MAVLSFNPTTKQATQDGQEFVRLLGECVSLWAFLDRELFNLAHAALGTDEKRTAIVFYGMNSINGHLNLVDDLMRHRLSDAHFTDRWRPLRKLIRRHLDTRSIYAHHPIKRMGTGKHGRTFYLYSVHIEPAEQLLQRNHSGLGGKKELLAKDLRKHAHSLEKLVKQTSEIQNLLRPPLAP